MSNRYHPSDVSSRGRKVQVSSKATSHPGDGKYRYHPKRRLIQGTESTRDEQSTNNDSSFLDRPSRHPYDVAKRIMFLTFLTRGRIYPLKDIVQPKKRGVKRGANRFVSTLYTIAGVF